MKITILGTGTLATALGTAWARAGHDLVVAGRAPERAAALAARLGARSAAPRAAVAEADAVLLAVSWAGVPAMLAEAGAGAGSLAGVALVDPVNAVRHGVGTLLLPTTSAAQDIAARAPGAHVVKAFHLFPATQWTADGAPATVVTCGDDAAALRTVGQLVRDAGAEPAVMGGLDRARQLEEAAGFVIGLAFAGHDPASAVPRA